MSASRSSSESGIANRLWRIGIAAGLLMAMIETAPVSAQTANDMLRMFNNLQRSVPQYHAPRQRAPARHNREAVYRAQTILNALGYNAGPADGAMGPRTRAALTAFQRDHGLRATAVPDAQTLGALHRADESRRGVAQPDRTRIRQAQEMLYVLGYDAGPADGVMGLQTRSALEAFQRDSGQRVTGTLDDRTLDALADAMEGGETEWDVMASGAADEVRAPGLSGLYQPQSSGLQPLLVHGVPYNDVEVLDIQIGDNSIRAERALPTDPGRPFVFAQGGCLVSVTPTDHPGVQALYVRSSGRCDAGMGFANLDETFERADARSLSQRGGTETGARGSETAELLQDGPTISILGVTIPEPVPAEIPLAWHQVRDFVPAELLATPAEPLTRAQAGARVSAMQAERGAEYERALDLLATVAAAANPEHGADDIRLVLAEWSISPALPGEVIGDMRADVVIRDQVVLRPEAQALANSLEIERLARENAALTLVADEFGPAGMDRAAGMQAQTTPAQNDRPRVAAAQPVGPEITGMIDGLAFHDGRPRDHRQMTPAHTGFQKLLHLAHIGQRPRILEDRIRAGTYGQMLLPQSRRDALLNRSRWKGDDEFERARSLERFQSEDAPRLVAAAPALPLPVVLYGQLHLGTYNAELGGFPVRDTSHSFALHIGNRQVKAQFVVPDLLPAPNAAEAEALARRIEGGVATGTRVLHVAAWVTIQSIGPEVHDITYRLERLVAYSDAEWTRVVHEFPLSQAPLAYLHDFGAPVAPAGPVRIDYETVFLATLAAESDEPGGIDWRTRASQRWDLERSVYRRDSGSRWHDYEPWKPFFPITGGDFAAMAGNYERWTRARAAALPETLVLESIGFLQRNGRIQESSLSVADGIPAVAPQPRPGALASPGIDRRGTHVPAYRRSSDYDTMVRQTVGGTADRLVVIGERGEGGLLFPRPVTEYRLPFDQAALRQAAGGARFEVHLTLKRGRVQRLEAGKRTLTVLHVTPVSAEVRIGDEIVAVAEFEAEADIPYGEADLAAAAPVGTMALDPEVIDLLYLRHLDDEVTESDWTRMFVGRWALEQTTPENEEPAWGRFFRHVAHEPDGAEFARLMPQFRTWTQERAAMLPERFLLTLPRETPEPARLVLDPTLRGKIDIVRSYGSCMQTVERIAADNERFGEAAAKACDFIRASDQLQEPYTALASSFAGVGLRASCQLWTGPALAYCRRTVEWHRRDTRNRAFNELFAVSQQAVEPLPAGGPEVQHIVLELSVEGARIAEELPGPRFAEALDALRAFQRETGASLASGWSPTWANVQTPVPVFDITLKGVSVQDAETGEELARLSVGPTDELPLDMLALPESDLAERVDIIGIRLGMDFEEAEAIIGEHMDVGRVVVADRSLRPDTLISGFGPYTSGKILISKDGNEFFALFDEPPAAPGKVVAMWRRFHLPKGQILPADFLRSVVARYGEPGWRETHGRAGESGLLLVWSDTLIMHRNCLGFEEKVQSGVWFEDGLPTNWQPPGQSRRLQLPEMGSESDFRAERTGEISGVRFCDAQLGARYVTSTSAPAEGYSPRDDEITVWLRDNKAYRELLNESRRIGPDAAAVDADDVPEDGPGVEIRF